MRNLIFQIDFSLPNFAEIFCNLYDFIGLFWRVCAKIIIKISYVQKIWFYIVTFTSDDFYICMKMIHY